MTPLTLFDAYGRPVDFDALRVEQAAAQAIGIRNIYAVEHPEVALTPQKLIGILRLAELGNPYFYLELAEAMEEKDLHYLAVLGTRKHAVAKLDLTIQPASDSDDDRRAADFARDALLDGGIDLQAAMFDILDAIGKGFSVTEIIWDTKGERWFPQALKWRDPR